jgi:hypothetical protein
MALPHFGLWRPAFRALRELGEESMAILRNEAKKSLGFQVGWAAGAENQMVFAVAVRLKWDRMVGVSL